jgi:hypothetical protein
MQISYLNKDRLVKTEIKDYVSSNVVADEKSLLELKKRKNITIIGLGAFYIMLVLVSLFIIT